MESKFVLKWTNYGIEKFKPKLEGGKSKVHEKLNKI